MKVVVNDYSESEAESEAEAEEDEVSTAFVEI